MYVWTWKYVQVTNCSVLYDTSDTSEDRLSSLAPESLTDAVITTGLKDIRNASIVIVVL